MTSNSGKCVCISHLYLFVTRLFWKIVKKTVQQYNSNLTVHFGSGLYNSPRVVTFKVFVPNNVYRSTVPGKQFGDCVSPIVSCRLSYCPALSEAGQMEAMSRTDFKASTNTHWVLR